jgi:leader peptidase (prepilin peptidase) / N-methyltransferase
MTIRSPMAGVMGLRVPWADHSRLRASRALLGPPAVGIAWRAGAVIVGMVAAAAISAALLRPAMAAAVTAAALVPIVYSDLRVRRIPTRVVYGAAAAVLVSLVFAALTQGGWGWFAVAMTSAAATVVLLSAVWHVWPATLGFGDVRLAGLVSLTAGWHGIDAVVAMWWWTAVAAFVLAVVARVGGRRSIPLAPAVALGWAVALGAVA